MGRNMGQHLARVWRLATPYFASDQKWSARALLASIVLLNLALVYINVLFNDWNKLFYDALQERDQAVFWQQLVRFGYLAVGFIVVAVYQFYLTQLLEMRWRAWMTRQYLARWLGHQAFYRLELARFGSGSAAHHPDNPDQRIQEDVNQFTGLTLSLTMGLLNSVVTLASFVGILWTLSGGFAFTLQGSAYVIPGFMVWMALLYCVLGSVLTHYIGRPQIGLNFQQQQVEADFRHRMLRVREYSESIALDRGEQVELAQLHRRFGKVLGNYLALINAQKRLVWFTSFFGQAAVVFPFVVAAPRFFSGAIQLGELMQISSAFGQVQRALSWFVESYRELAVWRATTDRLTGFEASFDALSTPAQTSATAAPDDRVAERSSADPFALQTHSLSVRLPNSMTLIADATLQVAPGDTVLLQGPSGSGKSTLFRTFAGIWPYASGQVVTARDAMFVPQRTYFPEGSLRDALAYPQPSTAFNDGELQQALHDALLDRLAGQLDASAAWGQTLSGGEQQRLAIARVLLKKPRWIFADECTSALDTAAETVLYQRLTTLVAQRHGALVSIAHRPGVQAFHNRLWILEPQAPGAETLFALREKLA